LITAPRIKPFWKAAPACYGSQVPVTGSAPTPEALEARETLSKLLESAYGDADDARSAIERALQRSNRAEFPATVADILTFVRTGLLPVLSDDLGPRLTMTVLEDFIAVHEVRSSVRAKESTEPPVPVGRMQPRPRSSTRAHGPRVLLVDADRIGRLALARALVRETCQVSVVDSLDELGQVVRSGDDIHVAILDGRHPARLLLMDMIVDRFPDVSLVVRTTGEAATRALVQGLGVARFEVLASDAPPEVVIAAVLKLIPVDPSRLG
jgi:CheY-like chemotaxis protein